MEPTAQYWRQWRRPCNNTGALDAVRTTARRTIAASETAYDLLSNQFLFRPRGSYFLPENGNMRTFVMVGRI